MSEQFGDLTGKGKEKMNKDLSAAEARELAEKEQRVPGTDNFHPRGDGPVGRHGIEAASIIGHDNLEAKTEIEKDIERQTWEDPDASDHR